ncbi:MAG: UvrD-helicase domain-containing protein, partial [Clostridia bacterium]
MNNLIKDKKLMTADCFTTQQKQVIEEKNKNLLVSASAGTGKTTVMIERIVNLIKTNAIDVSDIIVVTFTELAAAEMKQRLLLKLLECKEDERVYEQLEKLDMCSISTLHAFCLNILKNYFYLADLDPNFSVLDDVTGCKLKNSALTSTLSKFKETDDVFGKVFHIFEQGRSDETLRAQILSLYSYYCANDNFDEWYASIRDNYFNCNDNTYEQLLNATLCEEFKAISDDFTSLAVTAKKYGSDKLATYCESLSSSYTVNSAKSLYDNVACLYSTEKDNFISSLKKYSDKFCVSEQEFSLLVNKIDREKKSAKCRSDDFINMISPYTKQELREKTSDMLPYVDKLVEVMRAFGQEYAENKKQRGMVDFNDMEKFALVVLQNPQANAELKEKYKMIFVDEYQDINPIQEKIICLLSSPRNAFMVGDTKQSIFGFRGCDSTIFTQRYETYSTNEDDNLIVGLNSNFRSDKVILDFVNTIFSNCMTKSFGNLDYKKYAMLRSSFSDKQKFPTVTIDALPRIEKEKIDNATSYYDFTEDNVNNNLSNNSEATREGILIAKRIKQLIGSRIFHRGEERTIKYSDIVILSRNLTEKAKQIYNELVRQHIPVSVNLKSNTVTKEIADLINLLRAVDNPYIDKYIVSVCLSFFGKMTTEEVSKIKIATTEDICFYDRLLHYVSRNDEVAKKIDNLLAFLSSARLLANSMTVDKLLLNITSTCNYYLYVAGLPNGEYRLSRMYTFIESIKSTEFALSISKFLSQIDISFSNNVNCADTDAVRFLTIHNCKGLEFPIVFLCNTSCVYQQNNNIMGIDKNIGLTLAYYDFDTLTKSPSLASIARNIVETKKR